MTTFGMGAALAVDYGQTTVRALGIAMRSEVVPSFEDAQSRRAAFEALNAAISRAVQAQMDELQECICPDAPCCGREDEDDFLMHSGGMECFFCAYPCKTVVVSRVVGL